MTRDEAADGPLSRALAGGAFAPVPVPGAGRGAARRSRGPGRRGRDARPLRLDRVRQRAFGAGAGPRPQPTVAGRGAHGRRRRADGAGAAGRRRDPAAVAGDGDGADALWTRLRDADAWPGRRVLVPTTPGGRRVLAEALDAAGAQVDEVETYRMEARPAAAIASDWRAAAPDAAVIASPRVATGLVEAIGAGALRDLRAHRRHRRHHRRGLTAAERGGGRRRRGRLQRRGAHAGQPAGRGGRPMIQEAETASEVMDRTFVECSALGFQSVVTSMLAHRLLRAVAAPARRRTS